MVYDPYAYLFGPLGAKAGNPPSNGKKYNTEDAIQELGMSPEDAYAKYGKGSCFAPLSSAGAVNAPVNYQIPESFAPVAQAAPQGLPPMLQALTAPTDAAQAQAPSMSSMTSAPATDAWHPHRRTTLGGIADVLISLLLPGFHPFADKNNNQNMEEAMQDFTTDPLKSIRRLAMLHGHEGDATKLYENYVDDNRQQGTLDRQNRALDMRNDDYMYNQTANMMGAANEQNWPQMRELAIKRGQMRGVDVSGLIPEQYDPDSIEFIRNGAVKTKDQMRMAETNRHNEATEGQAATNEAGRDTRFEKGQDRQDARQQVSETGKNNRQQQRIDTRPSANRPTTVMTKYGVGMVNKDRTQMLLQRDGKHYLYAKGGINPDGSINWVPQGEVEAK
jgi:hypothetical protein